MICPRSDDDGGGVKIRISVQTDTSPTIRKLFFKSLTIIENSSQLKLLIIINNNTFINNVNTEGLALKRGEYNTILINAND